MGQLRVVRVFERDNDEVTGADVGRVAVNLRLWQVEVARDALHAQSILVHSIEVAAEQEMNIMPMKGESSAVVAANGTGTDDSDACGEGIKRKGRHGVPSMMKSPWGSRALCH